MGTDIRPNFAFVVNVGSLIDSDHFLLAPGHILRRATSEEITTILAKSERLLPPFPINWWESRVAEAGAVERLPESEWRYFVIEFHGDNSVMSDLELVFTFTPLSLEVAFLVMNEGMFASSYIWHPGGLQQIPPMFFPQYFMTVDVDAAVAISGTYERLLKHDPSLVDVKQYAQELYQLRAIPGKSPLLFLGYFAVLESLLTHSPHPTDPYDSITRQVSNKVALLGRRCAVAVDYSEFREVGIASLWKKMYAYRSCLAHGDKPDFQHNLAVLKDHERASKLLKDTVKAILRQALIEPQLLADLKNC